MSFHLSMLNEHLGGNMYMFDDGFACLCNFAYFARNWHDFVCVMCFGVCEC